MKRQLRFLPLTLAAILMLGVASNAQLVLLSDSFDRTLGNNDAGAGPIASDWGANDNALGGSLSGSYIVSAPNGDFDVELVNGDQGEIAFGRTILDVNLATPAAIAAGGITVRVDVSPSDIGLSAFNGRDWLGFVLADTNDAVSLGGAGALFGGNPDSRVGVGARNSGSAITRASGGTGVIAGGNPAAGGGTVPEPIFDQAAFDAYVIHQGGGDPTDEFVSDTVYTVEMRFLETAPGNLFADGATNRVELFIAEEGTPLVQIPLNPANPSADTFVWGDNATTAGPNAGDLTPGVRDAYLAFVANANGGHLFDNLVVSTVIPEPTSAVLGGFVLLAALCGRGRVR